jgi:phenylalanyl-tRNA synthetase alpha chain
MLEKIKALQDEIRNSVATTIEEVEELRLKYISKKGSISQLFDDFKNVHPNKKRKLVKQLTTLKNFALDKINALKEAFETAGSNGNLDLDLTMPANR